MKFKQKLSILLIASTIISGLSTSFIPKTASAADTARSIVFPVQGGATYRNDYGEPRTGGRTHEGNDLMAGKMRPLLAVADGTISFLTVNEATWGWSLTIVDSEGYKYNYLHINNDSPGTDDGLGGYNNAFFAGIQLGSRVIKGQQVAFVGDSGNAETTAPHLHFEIREPGSDTPINPYASLQAAPVLTQAVVNPNPTVVTNPPRYPNPNPTPTPNPYPTPTPTPTTNTPSDIIPYDQFVGGANISSGNFDADTEPEFVTGTSFGGNGKSTVKLFDNNGTQQKEFFAYGDSFSGGVDVTRGDVDGDGVFEIITAAGIGGGPHIKVLKPDGSLVSEFMAYAANFRGGVHIASADIDGDGKAEIITSPAAGGGPHVKVFDKTGKLKLQLMAYSAGFTGGVDVAAFAPSGSFAGGFITSPLAGGGPHVKVYSATGQVVNQFMAYPASFTGGVRIDAGNFIQNNASFEVVTSPASNASSNTKIFKLDGTALKSSYTSFESVWTGGSDVAIVGSEVYIASSGGRQTAIKKVVF